MAKKKADEPSDYQQTAPKMQDAATDIIEELEEEKRKAKTGEEVIKTNVLPELPPVPDPMPKQTPIYEMQLSDDEQALILKARMQTIVAKNKIPFIPTLIKTTTYESSMPVKILIQLDHTIVKEAWEFYSLNVRDPEGKGFVEMLNGILGERGRIIQRVVEMNLL